MLQTMQAAQSRRSLTSGSIARYPSTDCSLRNRYSEEGVFLTQQEQPERARLGHRSGRAMLLNRWKSGMCAAYFHELPVMARCARSALRHEVREAEGPLLSRLKGATARSTGLRSHLIR